LSPGDPKLRVGAIERGKGHLRELAKMGMVRVRGMGMVIWVGREYRMRVVRIWMRIHWGWVNWWQMGRIN
jgi:hypothetical protein